MVNSIRRYWDANCCYAYLWNQAGRADKCEDSIKDAEAGHSEIVISALTIAEVLHLKGVKRDFPHKMRDDIRGFFRRRIFVVAEVDRMIAEKAQDVFWEYVIMPKDAIHVATALSVGAHFLETFDNGLIEHSRRLGGDPQLVVHHAGDDIRAREEAKRAQRTQGLLGLDGAPLSPRSLQ